MDMPAVLQPRKGRGAVSNASGRFEREQRVPFDDGWDAADPQPPPLETILGVDATRTIIARNQSPDIGFDRSINPYRGCEHGCIYCYARPSHAYLGLSPGLDFESRIFYKPQAAALLAAELRKKNYVCRPIALGSNTDPYQPVERRLGITRAILEVLRDFRHPVTIVSKGALIRRDIDILAEMASERLAIVTISLTTLDRALARRMEPRARPRAPDRDDRRPRRRRDPDRRPRRADDPGAQRQRIGAAARTGPRRRCRCRRLHFAAPAVGAEGPVPGMARNACAGEGRACAVAGRPDPWRPARQRSAWSTRMTGTGPHAEMLRRRFERACRRLGFAERSAKPLDTSRFCPPPQPGEQLALF